MKKDYRVVLAALAFAVGLMAAFVGLVGAAEKTPPYVVAIESTGLDSTPKRVGVDPVTGRGYVLDGRGRVWVFTGTDILDSVPVGSPADIAVDPGRYVYLTSRTERNPVTILPAWGGEKETVAVGGGEYSRPSGAAAVMTSTHHAYIVLPEDDAVSVLSGTHIVAEKIGVGSQPVDVAVDPGERLTYVVNKGSNNVTVLHETTVIQTVTVGITPTKVTVNPVNHLAYVTNSGNNTVTIIDPTSGYATTTRNVGDEPKAIAVNPTLDQIYVANAGDNSLSVLQGKNYSATKALGDAPQAVAVNPATGYVYVVGGVDEAGTITVLSSSLASETYVPVGHSPRDVGVIPVTDGDWAYAAMYKGTGGDDEGRIVILGRSEACRGVLEDGKALSMTCEGSGGEYRVHVPAQQIPGEDAVDLIGTAWTPETGNDVVFAGQGFLLKAYIKGSHQAGFTFSPSATVGVNYPDPAARDLDEDNLELQHGPPRGPWVTTGISTVVPPQNQVLTVTLSSLPVNALSGYAVVEPKSLVYLPLVMRD
jgi:YVTN family beta-propeller protein